MHPSFVGRPVFVVFEGLDGVGKSSSARDLTNKLGAELICTSSPEVADQVRALKQHYLHYQEISHFLYLGVVEKASIRAKEILASGRSVVMDRYLLSTTVYAKARGSQLQDKRDYSCLLAPDLTVFLSLESSERKRRLQARGGSTPEDIESLNKSFEDELLRAYRGLQGHRIVGEWLQLDSKLSTENITTRVIDNLEHLLAPKKLCRGAFL